MRQQTLGEMGRTFAYDDAGRLVGVDSESLVYLDDTRISERRQGRSVERLEYSKDHGELIGKLCL